jgi:hypothetical protein
MEKGPSIPRSELEEVEEDEMKSRIARVSIHQTAKTLAFIYGLLALIILPVVVLISMNQPPVDETVPWIVWIFFPPLYAAAAYVGFAILLAIYNFIAKRSGGVELEMESVETPSVI